MHTRISVSNCFNKTLVTHSHAESRWITGKIMLKPKKRLSCSCKIAFCHVFSFLNICLTVKQFFMNSDRIGKTRFFWRMKPLDGLMFVRDERFHTWERTETKEIIYDQIFEQFVMLISTQYWPQSTNNENIKEHDLIDSLWTINVQTTYIITNLMLWIASWVTVSATERVTLKPHTKA